MHLSKSLILGLTFAGLTLALAGAAHAQVPLPSPPLPALPGAGLPAEGVPAGGIGLPSPVDSGIDRTVSRLRRTPDVRQLAALRQQRITALIRRYPRLIERDPRGDPMVRGDLVAYAPSDAALARARAAGFTVVSDRSLDGIGARIAVLRAPARLSTARALDALRALDPAGTYDFDHVYSESDSGAADAPSTAAGRASMQSAAAGARVGLIDSGVEVHHPVFDDVPVQRYGCGGAAVPAEHGTEVASLLVGRAARFRGAAPGAALFAADVYCGLPSGGSVDSIATAFDWLARERVPVINVSLVGPANALLAAIVHSMIARGYLIVAAVGNDGPAAPPLYPAAYPGVIGVTGVDGHRQVLLEAERGAQVRFAAPGADISAAVPPRGFAEVRGTSFAAPIVAGLLAREIDAPDPAAAARALESLERRAIDLGAPGPDPVYGSGLVLVGSKH